MPNAYAAALITKLSSELCQIEEDWRCLALVGGENLFDELGSEDICVMNVTHMEKVARTQIEADLAKLALVCARPSLSCSFGSSHTTWSHNHQSFW